MASRKRKTARRTAARTTPQRQSQSPAPSQKAIPGQVAVRYCDGQEQKVFQAVKAEHGLTIGKRNEFEPRQYIVKVPRASGTHTLDVARSLDRRKDVEFASPNFLTTLKR
jgi:hypothetical protein